MSSIPLSYKLKKIFTNWRVLLMLVFIIGTLIALHPSPNNEGAAIRTVDRNSSAEASGFVSPKPTDRPLSREVITFINDQPIRSAADYEKAKTTWHVNQTLSIRTNKVSRPYRVVVQEQLETIVLNETEVVSQTTEVWNETVNRTQNVTQRVERPKTRTISRGPADIGLTVYDAPKTNLRKGLDLQGGSRVLLKPQEQISPEDLESIIGSMSERLNVYGLTDVVIRSARDLNGDYYIIVEIAGANEKEVRELLSKQGKFEAKVGNDTVFRGGNDVTYVCRTAECSGLDPNYGCRQLDASTHTCRFMFSISLSPEAAQRQADATKDLEVLTQDGQKYLSKPLDLYLDDELVDSLQIGSELRGRATTDIAISGAGQGVSEELASFDALQNMKRLQTILITGSLPVQLDIVKTDSVSPVLGEEFLKNSLFIGIIAAISVCVVVFIGYRTMTIVLPIIFIATMEIVMLLGVAALIGWNLDVASIAGIIVAVGTGVSDQIVITDETLRGQKQHLSFKQRIKQAFFIVMGAYFTNTVAMLPLLFAGAGLLKGFAITTLIGVTIGVFITRPAFAQIIEILLQDEEKDQ